MYLIINVLILWYSVWHTKALAFNRGGGGGVEAGARRGGFILPGKKLFQREWSAPGLPVRWRCVPDLLGTKKKKGGAPWGGPDPGMTTAAFARLGTRRR